MRVSNDTWNIKYNLLTKFVKNNGKLPVYSDIIEGIEIGVWLGNQKISHKEGKLSKERLDLLNSVGFSMDSSIFDGKWKENFDLLAEFVKNNDRLPINKDKIKGVKIGNWFHIQKNLHKQGKLSKERFDLLNSYDGFFDDVNEVLWKENFNLLSEFVKNNGKLPIQNNRLGNWCAVQKKYQKEGKLSKERFNLLNSYDGFFVYQDDDTIWKNHFKSLTEFVKNNGRLPNKSDETKLYNWCSTQKRYQKEGKLPKENFDLLDSIKFFKKLNTTEAIFETKWGNNFNLLSEFVKNNGKLPIYSDTIKGVKIGNWCNTQKLLQKNGELSKERFDLLNSFDDFFISNKKTYSKKLKKWAMDNPIEFKNAKRLNIIDEIEKILKEVFKESANKKKASNNY